MVGKLTIGVTDSALIPHLQEFIDKGYVVEVVAGYDLILGPQAWHVRAAHVEAGLVGDAVAAARKWVRESVKGVPVRYVAPVKKDPSTKKTRKKGGKGDDGGNRGQSAGDPQLGGDEGTGVAGRGAGGTGQAGRGGGGEGFKLSQEN